ncbi:MAG: thioredoxin fold domain-containing protein [Bdellovibrionaceae bacterium]|nr:thioredoxin fold domain-containing protein [Bdellovibrio sp.]
MKIFALILVNFFAFNAFARVTDNKTKIEMKASELIITTMEGFHLNAEAPASINFDGNTAKEKPATKTEKLFIFKTPSNAKVARLAFYVCDNKKTVCEQHRTEFDLKTSQAKQSTARAETWAPAKAVNLISENGKPTLLVFSAPWCPACIRMQTEIYHQPAVEKQIKQINFLKVNSDLVENYDLSEKFHVKAIPTLILLNAQGEEVFRWLDFQPANTFAKSLASEAAKAKESESLLKLAQQGDLNAASKLGMREYNSLNCVAATKWLALSTKPEDQKYKLAAEVSCAEDKADEDPKFKGDYLRTLEKSILLTSSQWDQIRWFVKWIEKQKEDGPLTTDIKAKALDIKNTIERLLKDAKNAKKIFLDSTYGEAGDFEKEEMLNTLATIDDVLDQPEQKSQTQKRSIELINKRKFTVERPGHMLLGLAYLREAGEKENVTKMYQALIKKFPDTYVYYEKYARFALKNKKYDNALALAENAIQRNEGNAPQLYLLKTKILNEMKNSEKALATVEEALQLQDIDHARFKKTRTQLIALKDELSKPVKK